MQKAIRMKTSSQLKKIFDELGIDHKGLDKEGLRKKAYKENAVGRWEELHPEKKPKPRKSGGGGAGGMPDFGGKPPDGMDPDKWEDLMAQASPRPLRAYACADCHRRGLPPNHRRSPTHRSMHAPPARDVPPLADAR